MVTLSGDSQRFPFSSAAASAILAPVSDSDEPDVHEEVAGLLDLAGHRYTKGRRRLVETLAEIDGPVTIGEILESDGQLPQSSVYRNLVILEESGAVSRIVTDDDFARYELAEHLTEHHHHLICSTCGSVSDFALSARTETSLDRALKAAADAVGFAPSGHRLDLLGTCSTCM